jgi:hypothetical protein
VQGADSAALCLGSESDALDLYCYMCPHTTTMYMYIRIYVSIYVSIYVYIWLYIYTCMYVCMYVCLFRAEVYTAEVIVQVSSARTCFSYLVMCVCVCVCVREREREREVRHLQHLFTEGKSI